AIARRQFTRQSAGDGYATYHLYSSDTPLTSVACSDGLNGLISKYGYNSVAPLYPYVMAMSGVSWNSPQCGTCWKITNEATGTSVNIAVIDGAGSVDGYGAHFDISPDAFNQLDSGSGAGMAAGHMIVQYEQVDTSSCQGLS
ncbi:unnamed protein product, partial [Didymodactylos carnosus]